MRPTLTRLETGAEMVRAILVDAVVGLAIALAAGSMAVSARPIQAAVEGVTVEATATPARWLGLFPTTTVRFEVAIYVGTGVRSFSAIQYECRFVDPDGAELGLASRGVAARDTFVPAGDGRMVSRAREELMDREPAAVRCKAIRLEK